MKLKFFILGLLLLITVFVSFIYTSNIRKEQPMVLNVKYETPTRDLDEQRKYATEHINYTRKVKRLEQKFNDDIELIKMVMNVQNIQIQKLNEIVMVNKEIVNSLIETQHQ